jgi:hypothetical protein
LSKRLPAYSLIRRQPHYRHEAFLSGLAAAGYEVRPGAPWWPAGPGHVLVIWNRYGDVERIADRFEKEGGTVLVAENGYLGKSGISPRDQAHAGVTGDTYYALSRHAHNGRGQWPEGGPGRWDALGITLQPVRSDGDYVLICPNRSFGMAGGIMPEQWADRIAAELKNERVRIRHHPGNHRSPVPLEHDLAGAKRVVIWSSSVGIQALLLGVEVDCRAPWWICKAAANSVEDARLPALQRMAWAQWTVDEIASGEPFRRLLEQ